MSATFGCSQTVVSKGGGVHTHTRTHTQRDTAALYSRLAWKAGNFRRASLNFGLLAPSSECGNPLGCLSGKREAPGRSNVFANFDVFSKMES